MVKRNSHDQNVDAYFGYTSDHTVEATRQVRTEQVKYGSQKQIPSLELNLETRKRFTVVRHSARNDFCFSSLLIRSFHPLETSTKYKRDYPTDKAIRPSVSKVKG